MSEVNTSNIQPFDLGFLEQIVAISFPAGTGYVLITINAFSTSQSSIPPAAPSATLSLNNSAKAVLLDHTSAIQTNVIQPHDVITPTFFLWDPQAPFPTNFNFNDLIGISNGIGIGPTTYGNQFNVQYLLTAQTILQGFIDPITHQRVFLPPLPPLNLASAASAQKCVDAYNAYLNGLSLGDPPFFHNYWLDQNPPKAKSADGRGLLEVGELFNTTHVAGSATATLVAQYLVKVGNNATLIVSTTDSGFPSKATVRADLYLKQKTKIAKITDLQPPITSTSTTQSLVSGTSFYSVVSDVGAKLVTVTGLLGP